MEQKVNSHRPQPPKGALDFRKYLREPSVYKYLH